MISWLQTANVTEWVRLITLSNNATTDDVDKIEHADDDNNLTVTVKRMYKKTTDSTSMS